MGHDSTIPAQEDAMNRTRRTALTATIAAAIIGGASAVVAANAADSTAGAETSAATSSPTSSATSSTDPVEAQLRDSVRSLEDEIAALELVATLATDDTTTRPSATATRTAVGFDRHGANAGPGNEGVEDDGVHQHRNRGGDDADDDDGGHHSSGDDDSGHGDDDSSDDDSGHGGHDACGDDD
jgi:hypothetical protein